MRALDERAAAELLPRRRPDSHKGTYGKLLIVGGGRNMAGAALMAGEAALRSGCGMIRLLVPESNRIIVQVSLPEALVSTYTDMPDESAVIEDIGWSDAVVVGPGLGQSGAAVMLCRTVMKHCAAPVVADADALNIISRDSSILEEAAGDVVITPHPGEMSRLTGRSVADIREDMPRAAASFAGEYGVTCLLKDHRSVIAESGKAVYENRTGNSGMSTAGSGDVLAGITGSLLAQGMRPPEAALLAAWMHGRSGDFAAAELTGRYMIARDIISNLKNVFRLLESF